MSGGDIRHQMDFTLKQRAIFSSDIIELKNRLDRLTSVRPTSKLESR